MSRGAGGFLILFSVLRVPVAQNPPVYQKYTSKLY